MGSEVPSHLVPVMVRTLALDNADPNFKEYCLQHLLVLMSDKSVKHKIIYDNIDELLKGFFKILETSNGNVKVVCMCLVNLSAEEYGLNKIISFITNDSNSNGVGTISIILQHINQKILEITNLLFMLLSNLTRNKTNANIVYQAFIDQTATLESFIKMLSLRDAANDTNYDYISYVLSNLTQLHEVRIWLMNSGNLQKLIPFLNHKNSLRRTGVIITIKNCCFELEKHMWLLSEDLDLLPQLLLPLAGPEQFDDEDNEKLPLDLQYLPDDKERESDPILRLALLEALTQLCSKRNCREIIRDQGTYLILRELHKWEPNIEVKLACENLVDILIKTEDEIGTDNFHDLDVPEDLIDKFKKMDEAYLN